MNKPTRTEPVVSPDPDAEKAHAALVARLSQLYRKPVRAPKSMQPTPEAAKSKIRRLRRKRQLLLRSKRISPPAN